MNLKKLPHLRYRLIQQLLPSFFLGRVILSYIKKIIITLVEFYLSDIHVYQLYELFKRLYTCISSSKHKDKFQENLPLVDSGVVDFLQSLALL